MFGKKTRTESDMLSKKAEEHSNQPATMAQTAEDAIIGKDLNGIITSWNKGAEAIFGYKESDVIGNPISILTEKAPQDSRQELIDTIKQLAIAQQTGHVGSWNFNLKTQKISGSAEAQRLFGLFDRDNSFDLQHIEACIPDRNRIHQALVDLITDGKPYDLEYVINPADGSEPRVIVSKATIEKDSEGNSVSVNGIVQDITENKLAQDKLLSQTALLEAQLNSTIDGILIVDKDNKRILTNQRMIELFKVPMDIAEDEDDFKLLKHVTDLTKNPGKFLEKIMYLNNNPDKVSSDEIEFTNGMVIDRYSAPVIGKAGESFGRIWIFRDITGRINAEKKVLEKETQFGKLSSQLPDLIFQFTRRPDGSYCVPIASPGIMNIFGCSPEDVRDDFGPIARVIFPEDSDRVIRDIEYSAEHLTYFTCEFRVQIPSREIQWIFSRSAPEKLEDGSITWYGFNADITAFKRTEETLKESNELRKSLLQTIPFGMDIVDESGKILFLSDNIKLNFGEQALGKKCWDLYRDDKKQCSGCPLVSGIKIGETKVNISSGMQGGKTFEIYHTGMIYDGQKAMLEAFIDITERKKAEDSLIRSEKELITTQQITHIGSWYLDVATNQVTWTQELYKMYGFDQALPPPPYTEHQKLFTPESWELLASSLANTRETGIPYELELKTVRKDGSNGWMWVRGETVLDKEGKTVGLWGAAQEITDRKRLEEELEKTNQRLMDAQSVAKIGSWETNLSNMDVKWSAETFRIFGLEPDSFHTTHPNFLEFVHPEDRAYTDRAFLESINTHSINTIQHRILTPQGEMKVVEENWRIFFDDQGKSIRALGTCADITDRKLVEKELIRAKEHAEESDRLKSAFLSNMSHEIRTPMNGILGFAELLKEPGLTGEEQQNYIRIIERSGARMLNIINNIIDISKIEAGQMEIVLSQISVKEVTEQLYFFFKTEAERKGIELLLRNLSTEKETIFTTDKIKFNSILSNLLKNALKYTHSGSIEFGYSLNDEPDESQTLQLFVKDTGIGIPKDRQECVFERFIQADVSDIQAYQGAGLGLSISKAYVEMLGGRIWLESEVGKGSTFYFSIPFVQVNGGQKSLIQTENIVTSEDSGTKPRILIAEDDPLSSDLLRVFLSSTSRELLFAKTGTEAVNICRSDPNIDIVLMDIKMPEMDGYEATKKIREFNNDIVIIAQTAFALVGDRDKAIKAGCNDYISKPITKNKILELIKLHTKSS